MVTKWDSMSRPAPRPGAFWRTAGIGLGVLVLAWLIVSTAWGVFERHATASRLRRLAAGDAEARREALDGIAALGVGAAPAVADALRSNDPSLRRAALLASRPVLAACIAKLDEMNCAFGIVPGRGAAESALVMLTEALGDALGDADEAIRIDAVKVLSGTSRVERDGIDPTMKRAAAVLQGALKRERDPSARTELVGLLGHFRPSLQLEGASALVEATNDPDEGVRQAAIHTLTESLDQSGIPREKDVRDELKAVAPLILPDASRRKDTRTLLALGELGETGAVSALIELLHDPDPTSRRAAAAALKRLGYIVFRSETVDDDRLAEQLRRSIPPLMAALEDPEADVRRHAADALGGMGAAALAAVPALEKAAGKETAPSLGRWMTDSAESINRAAEIDRLSGRSADAGAGRRRP